jgi:outer membrane protein OmpA-like peptidoglycan-associated protein
MRVRGLTLALLIALTTQASAQSAGTFEISGFGRFTRFADTLAMQEGGSGGGALGFYPIRNLALEVEAAYTQSHSHLSGVGISNIPVRTRLTYHLPMGGYASALRVGAGYLYNLYLDGVQYEDNGVTGVVGFRWGLRPNFAFRVDATADYVKSPDGNRADEYINWGAQAGLSFSVGKPSGPETPKDRDKDLVTDKMDSCPNTELGKIVDLTGCAAYQKDSDRDGVNDEADRCAETLAGSTVDPEGCSASQKDDDKDGILNPIDECPNTPWGENANSRGCAGSQRDEDRDGVSDSVDQCPNTPAGEAVNARGCFMERDSDGDNVPDKRDRCPNTPPGTPADANGCTITVVDDRDSDADGIPDRRDRCANTPAGTPADANGCPIPVVNESDSDGDGVPDRRDRCANTPAGTPADANGCPIPVLNESDADGDGVPDRRDRCANTPKGEAADANGCTIVVVDDRDSDGDGVPDRRDRCPETPKTETADAKGCTILFHKGTRSVILRGVTFASGKAMLTPQGREILRDVARQLVENPQYRVQISGHTDNVGSRTGNLQLSLARARTVETFLVAHGVPYTQLSAKGFGPDVPVAPNTSEAGRAQNRRVELNRTN